MHPLIQRILVAKSQASHAPYCVLEIPLLKDPKDYQLQRVLCIDCTSNQQIERLGARQLPASEIEGFMRLQIPRTTRLAMADDIVDNNQGIQAFKNKLWAIHQAYLRQAQSAG